MLTSHSAWDSYFGHTGSEPEKEGEKYVPVPTYVIVPALQSLTRWLIGARPLRSTISKRFPMAARRTCVARSGQTSASCAIQRATSYVLAIICLGARQEWVLPQFPCRFARSKGPKT